MDVVRHHDESGAERLMGCQTFLQDFHNDISRLLRKEKLASFVRAKGDEMAMARFVNPSLFGHE